MKLLIKFPTRGRVNQFFKVFDLYYTFLDDIENTKFLISCDIDDISMNNVEVINKIGTYKNVEIKFGNNKSKIEAINADMILQQDFDIVLLASDDMIPQVKGYDTIIRTNMATYFADTDGILWFNDGYQGSNLNTLCILGKKYFKRFNYIYHPDYKSLWCDNEFMEVGNYLGKQKYIDQIIIKHKHPDADSSIAYDELYHRNIKLDAVDRKTFERRRKVQFGLKPKVGIIEKIMRWWR